MQTLQAFPCSTAQRQLIRTACTTSNAALQSSCTQQLAGRIFHHRPALTLERAVGEKFGLDNELWTQAPFVAGVVPDLPVVSSWKQLGAKLIGRCANCGVCPILPTSLKQHLKVGLSTKGFLFLEPSVQRCIRCVHAHCRQVAAPQVLHHAEDKENRYLSVQSQRCLVQTVAAQVQQHVSGSGMKLAPLGPLHTACNITNLLHTAWRHADI